MATHKEKSGGVRGLDKSGQIETILVIGLVILVVSAGVVGSYKITSSNRFVGDTSTEPKIVYDLKYCDIRGYSDNIFVSFSSKQEAYDKGFVDAGCNV